MEEFAEIPRLSEAAGGGDFIDVLIAFPQEAASLGDLFLVDGLAERVAVHLAKYATEIVGVAADGGGDFSGMYALGKMGGDVPLCSAG